MLYEELSGRIIGAFYVVYRTLGHGFLEKVYENALGLELRRRGMNVEQQKRIEVYYDGIRVGEYYADLLVDGVVVLEVKAIDAIAPIHEAQLVNYLRATAIELGFLFTFGPKAQFSRRILTNERKEMLP